MINADSQICSTLPQQIPVNNWHEQVNVGDLYFYYAPQDPLNKVIAIVQKIGLWGRNPVAAKCVHVGLVVDKTDEDIKIAHSWGPNGGPMIETYSKYASLRRGKSIFMSAIAPKTVDNKIFIELIRKIGLQFSLSDPDNARSSYSRIVRQGLQPHYFSRYSKYDVAESVVDYLSGNFRIDHYNAGKAVPKAYGCSEYVYSILQAAYFLSLFEPKTLKDISASLINDSEKDRQRLIDVIYKNFDSLFDYKKNFYTQHSLSLTPAEIFHQLEVNYGATWKVYENIR